MANVQEKIAVLMEAMPYIKQYQGKVVVVKFGGNAMINEEVKRAVLEDVVVIVSK